MRQQILDILSEIESEQGGATEVSAMVRAFTDRLIESTSDALETNAMLREARNLMLDILLRLRPDTTDRLTELKADEFWDGSMREHFVEDAEKLAARPEIRDLYKEVHEEPDQPLNDFLNNLSGEVNQDLGYFVYSMLAEKATL